MPIPRPELEEVARRAEEIYDRDLRPVVEPEHVGKFLALETEAGDDEIDASELAAVKRAEAGRLGAGRSRFLLRIGDPAAHTMGGAWPKPRR